MATLLILCIGLPLFVSILKALFSAACSILSGLLNLTASAIDSAARNKPERIATVQVVTDRPNKYDLQIEKKRAARVKQIERAEQAKRKEAARIEKERAKAEQAARVMAFKVEQAKEDAAILRDRLESMSVMAAEYRAAYDKMERNRKEEVVTMIDGGCGSHPIIEERGETDKERAERLKMLNRCMVYESRAAQIRRQLNKAEHIVNGGA